MNWDDIYRQIPKEVEETRKEYILKNSIIKDDIFRILEKHCEVVYYPFDDEEKSRGFHIKRFMKDKLVDFVYINTAKSVADQIFGAAHELGHVWGVAAKIWEQLNYKEELTEDVEEIIVNRFAAELLMPKDIFRKTFFLHIEELGFDKKKIRLEEILRVMVMQMSDYIVPYEAVRRRLVETNIVTEDIGRVLNAENNPIEEIVKIYSKELNATFSNPTGKKTIPGLRDALLEAERKGALSDYVILKVKQDFDLEEVATTDELLNISGEDE